MDMTRWIDGLEQEALRLLPEAVGRYFLQGSGDGVTAGEAEATWREIRFRPHVLRDVTTVDVAGSVLGTPLAASVAIAPTTLQRHADDDGEVAMARGASAAGSLVCVSSNAGSTFAAVADTGAPWWVQVYVLGDRRVTEELLTRAVAAGARAVVLTVDTPVVATRHGAEPGAGETVWDVTPDGFVHANHSGSVAARDHTSLARAADLTPDAIGWLASVTGLPVVVKGVLRADDAHRAVEAGAAAVWVSNHGGRQLDGTIATRWALPEVVDAVQGRAEVYVDGGLRRGTDLMAAYAVGANAAFLGRTALWALTVGGSDGVTRLLDDLRAELVEAMRLAGCVSRAELTPDLVAGATERR
jgi:4-hydroxymandelate oxidase